MLSTKALRKGAFVTVSPRHDIFDYIAAPIFVLEVNKGGQPVYAAINTHALEISGRPASDYIGKTALDVYPDSYGRTAYAHHCFVIKNGQRAIYELDLPMAGKICSLRTQLNPQLGPNGQVERVYALSVDVTAEKNARESKVEFDTLSSEMEKFVALAAHDLRAPMRNVAILTDLLREGFQDHGDGKLELLDLIDKIAVKSMDLISDVLCHVEIKSTQADETVFSFPALCHQICDTLDPKGLHVYDSSLSTIRADRTVMMIALRNLIENAIKHGGRKPLAIDIQVATGMPGMIEVTLTDDGKGFSDAALKIMNGGQFRADSGYGLFGVKRLISARGGTLIARNTPDQTGAVVRFSLPGTLLGVASPPDLLTMQSDDLQSPSAA